KQFIFVNQCYYSVLGCLQNIVVQVETFYLSIVPENYGFDSNFGIRNYQQLKGKIYKVNLP
ncbi:hypothetical protein L9F63_000600, partial [Diploptera punctata]